MAQEQPRKEASGPKEKDAITAQGKPKREPSVEPSGPGKPDAITYGDMFYVSGQPSDKPILPEDAAAMESAEKVVMGRSPHGGPASVMRSAAEVNVEAGLVDPNSCGTTEGIRVKESNVGGTRTVTESVNNEVVGQYVEPGGVQSPRTTTLVTIGETLEAVAHCAGDQPIDNADAAAIEAAEKRAVGANAPPGWGLGAQAHNAAAWNAQGHRDEFLTTIDDVLKDASLKLPHDKAVTQEDAKVVLEAEINNDPGMSTTVGGVGEMMTAAARLNQFKK